MDWKLKGCKERKAEAVFYRLNNGFVSKSDTPTAAYYCCLLPLFCVHRVCSSTTVPNEQQILNMKGKKYEDSVETAFENDEGFLIEATIWNAGA